MARKMLVSHHITADDEATTVRSLCCIRLLRLCGAFPVQICMRARKCCSLENVSGLRKLI